MTELTEQTSITQNSIPKSKGKLQNRITLLLIAILIPILLLFAWFDITSQRNNLEAILLERAESTATSGAVTIASFLEQALKSGELSRDEIFDTDYQEFWQFNPTAYPEFDDDPATLTKYHTAYDAYTDEHLQELLDSFLSGEDLVFAIAADKNGYVPTHNTNSSTGDGNPTTDRTKRIFNDPVGIKAVQNTEPIIQQIYQQPGTGKTFWDVSSPIYIDGEHWGAFRVGIELSQNQERVITATWQTIIAMSLVVVLVAIFSLIVGRYVSAPIVKLTGVATLVAGGDLNQQAKIHNRQEISTLAQAFNSMTFQLRDLIKNLEARVSKRTKDLALAAEISQNVSQIRDVNELASTSVSLIQQHFNLYHAQLYVADAEQTNLTLLASSGDAGKQMLVAGHMLLIDSTSLNGRAAMEKHPILVSDTTDSVDFKPHELLPNTRSETAVPLLIGDTIVGVLDLQDDKPNTFIEENLPAYNTIAGQLAIAIENSNLFAEADHQAKRLSALNEMSADIATATDINEIYKVAGKYTQQIVGGQRASLGILDPDGQTFEVLGLSGEKGAIPLGTHLPIGKTAVGLCILENRLIIDGDGHPEKYVDIQKLAEQGLLSTISAPLTMSDKTIGALNIGSDQTNIFGGAERSLMQQIASLLSAAIENRQLLAQTEEALQETSIFRQLVENAGQGIGMATLEGNVLYTNPMLTNMLALDNNEDKLGQPLFQFYSEETQAKFQQEIMPTLIQQGNWVGEVGMTINGKSFPTNENYFLLHDENGKPFQLGAILTDISESKAAEAMAAKQAEDLQLVADINAIISSTLNTNQLLQDVVEQTKINFDLYHAHIYLLDEESRTLDLTVGAGDVGTEMVSMGHAIPINNEKSLVAQTARTKQGVIVNNVTIDPNFLPNSLLPDTLSEMAVPMLVSNKVIGVLDVQATSVNYFTSTNMNILTTLATQIAIALENARAFEQVSQQEEILRQRDVQLAQANELAGMATWEFDFKSQMFILNDQYYSTILETTIAEVGSYKLPASEFLEMFVYPEDAQSIIDEITNALTQTNPDFLGYVNYRLVDSNKKIRYVQNEYRLNFDDQGQLETGFGYVLDVTERKIAEEAIQRNEKLMRTIIDSTPDWIFVKDRQHQYQLVNKAYADSVKMETDELVGKTIQEIGLPEELAQTLFTEDEALMAGEEELVIVEEEIVTDEKTRYQNVTKVILRNASGQVQNMVGFAHDVTDQITAAQEQAFLQQELEEQLQQMNALQRAVTRDGWQGFMTMTADKRPFQGFEFNQDGISTLTAQDLTKSKNEKSTTPTNGNTDIINPVKVQGVTIGKIGVRTPSGESLSDEKRALLASLTNQVAEALDRARLFEETELGRQEIEEQAAELTTVNEISDLASTQLNLDDLLTAVGSRLGETFESISTYIALFDEKSQIVSFPYFYGTEDGHIEVEPKPIETGGGFTVQVIKARKPMLHNTPKDVNVQEETHQRGGVVIGDVMPDSFLAVPMIIGDAVVGVLSVSSFQENRTYDESDQQLMTILASTIGVAIQNAQQFENTQRRANREALVNEISQKIQNAPTIESAMQTAVAELGKALNLKQAIVKLNKPGENKTE